MSIFQEARKNVISNWLVRHGMSKIQAIAACEKLGAEWIGESYPEINDRVRNVIALYSK